MHWDAPSRSHTTPRSDPNQNNLPPPESSRSPKEGGGGRTRAAGGARAAKRMAAPAPPPPGGGGRPLVAASSAASPRRFGMEDFLWGSTLGEGSYARVVHAQLKSNGRHYAIKVMEKRHIRKENKVKQVLTEKHVLSRVAHEFVVKLWFTFQDTESLYLVLDLATGGELLSVIEHHKVQALKAGLGPQRACPWAVGRFYLGEVCLALEYLHGEGVVHRDVKPQNVLVSQQGHVKLTDFGSALCLSADAPKGPQPPAPPPPRALRTRRAPSSSSSSPSSSSSSSDDDDGSDGAKGNGRNGDVVEEEEQQRPHCSFVGTAEYVSPEVLANEPATPGVDLWAAGCLAYELLTGEPPFRGRSDYLTFQEIMAHCNGSQPLRFPAYLETECPPAVDLIRRLLVRDPHKRLGAETASGAGGSGAYVYSYSGSDGDAAGQTNGGGGEGGERGPRGYEALRVHPFFEGFAWEQVLAEPPPFVPPPEQAAALLREGMREGAMERADWLGLGLGFGGRGEEEGAGGEQEEEEVAIEPVALAPMASFTGGILMRPASMRRDSEEEEEHYQAEEAALSAAETALREAVTGVCPRARTWDRFLDVEGGERCVFTNLVWKRSGLLARRRQLVLTSRGRLLYLDAKAMVVKGAIAPEGLLRVEVRGEQAFDVVTPERVHHFTDYEVGSARWAAAIQGQTGGVGEPEPASSSSTPSPTPSSPAPLRMLPAALAMLGIGSPRSPTAADKACMLSVSGDQSKHV